MNSEEVRQIAIKKLVEIHDIQGASVLRGVHTVKNTPVAIYYIDYSETPLEIDQIQTYQEKLISSDYYNHSGPVQWNFYLLFIRESVDVDVKKSIEQNDIYTRKFILSPTEFKVYFDYAKSSYEIKGDIVIGWKEKLRKVDLQEVWSRSSYVSAIDRYIAGRAEKEKTVGNFPNVQTKAITNQHIERIQLDTGYRPFPLEREFKFTHVNLVSGINGVGKTSLLEAIELVLCGKSKRHAQSHEASGSISLVFKDGPVEHYTPDDNPKFQARDSGWYNNSYTQRNYLEQGFNRYNYFNAEAAYGLNNAGVKEYKTQLSSLALGSEYSYMADRLDGFQKRLQDIEKEYSKRLQQQQENITQAEAQKVAIGKLSDPANFIKQLRELFLKISWNSAVVDNIEKDISAVESSVSQVRTILTELVKAEQPRSSSALKMRTAEISKRNEALLDVEKKELELNKQIAEAESDLILHERRVDALREVERFYQTPRATEILGLDSSIRDLKNDLTLVDSISRLGSSIKWDLISDQRMTYNQIAKDTNENLAAARAEKSLMENQYGLLSVNLDKLTKLEVEIKSLGAEFINLNSSSDACPLCGTEYDHQELRRRISEIRMGMATGIDLIPIAEKLSKKEIEINTLVARSQQLSIVSEAAKQFILDVDIGREELVTIRARIEEAVDLKVLADRKLKELLAVREEVLKSGFTEIRLAELSTTIAQFRTDFDLKKYDSEKVKSLTSETLQTLDQVKVKLEVARAEHKKLQSSIKATIGSTKTLKEAKQDNDLSAEGLRKGVQYVEELSIHIAIDDRSDFTELDLKIRQIDDLLKRYKQTNVNTEQVKVIETIVSRSTNEIEKEIKPTLGRLRTGLEQIREIQAGDEKDKLLKEFFDRNDEQIQDIFQRIHAPRELRKVLFFTDGNDEIQIVRNNGKRSTIEEISSGQKSALALSIFLTLNKKLRNGPNMLMFDDPVAFVDDLNILSFLDYLREVAIHEDRQIFFATANQRLAGFFEKKFGFLKDSGEFSHIQLSR